MAKNTLKNQYRKAKQFSLTQVAQNIHFPFHASICFSDYRRYDRNIKVKKRYLCAIVSANIKFLFERSRVRN
jgi:hypothetical protein